MKFSGNQIKLNTVSWCSISFGFLKKCLVHSSSNKVALQESESEPAIDS